MSIDLSFFLYARIVLLLKKEKKNCFVFFHQIHQPLVMIFNRNDAGE
jgi:hypothetical protein